MNRILTGVTLAAWVLGGLGMAGQQPTFRGGRDAVRVFVTVTDKDGRLVTNLRQEHFEIRDDGKPQPITVFDNSPQPIRLIVMLDVSGSMAGNLPLLRQAAAQLFPRLGPDDVAKVGAFGREVTISSEFTRDAAALNAALPNDIEPDAPTPLWRGIDQAMAAFGREEDDRRKVILVLSDGKDTGATGPLSFSRSKAPASQAEVIDRARRDEVMIYGVGMRSRAQRSQGIPPGGLQAALLADMPDPGLARVAEEAGGGYVEIRPGQPLGLAFADIVQELHSQYLLAYAPPKKDGKAHDISVKVNQAGFKPRARKSYIAPKE
jgi:VWFA-related protein